MTPGPGARRTPPSGNLRGAVRGGTRAGGPRGLIGGPSAADDPRLSVDAVPGLSAAGGGCLSAEDADPPVGRGTTRPVADRPSHPAMAVPRLTGHSPCGNRAEQPAWPRRRESRSGAGRPWNIIWNNGSLRWRSDSLVWCRDSNSWPLVSDLGWFGGASLRERIVGSTAGSTSWVPSNTRIPGKWRRSSPVVLMPWRATAMARGCGTWSLHRRQGARWTSPSTDATIPTAPASGCDGGGTSIPRNALSTTVFPSPPPAGRSWTWQRSPVRMSSSVRLPGPSASDSSGHASFRG